MKILMTGLLPPENERNNGGVVSVIRILLESFSEISDLEVCHVSFNKELKTPKVIEASSNIRLIFLPFKSRVDLIDYLLNRKTLDAIIAQEKPDLIHIQEITPQLLRFLHLDRSKIVVTQHGIMKEELKYFDRLSTRLKGLFKALVERFVFPLFPNVLFISEYSRGLFPRKPVFSEIIFNPVRKFFFNQDSSTGDPNTILFAAAFSRIKNTGLLLSALAELKKFGIICRLHLAGGFKNKYYERLIQQTVADLGLNDQVIFHGWCTPKKIQELMSQCALFILPSRQETMPVVIGEAMAMGRIVIASDVGAVSEMFTDGSSGFLFPDNDKDALIAILKMVLFDPALRKRVSRNAALEAKNRFYPDLIAGKTLRFYEKILQHHSQPVSA